MSKVAKKVNQPKLAVEEYRACGSQIECDCFVPGENRDDTFIKMVSLGELYYHVKGDDGKVWVTYQGDSENCNPVTFDEWYDGNKTSLHDVLADIINKRESRELMAELPDVKSAINNIISHFKASA